MKYKITEKQDAVKSNVPKEPVKPITLTREQQQNFKLYGQLNRPEVKQTTIGQGKKKTIEEQKASDKKLAEQEKIQNYQKQKVKEAKDLQRSIEIAPYLIPGIGQAMWAGKAIDVATNGASKGKYKSWGDMVNQKTGSGEFVGDLTNPGYYAGALPKLLGKGIQSTSKYAFRKAEPYLLGEKSIPMMNGYKPKMSFVENGIENGIDAKTFGTNRIFEGKPLMISSNENAFKTTAGKFYRLTGQPQIDDIANNGGYVLAKRGKIKGGRFGETHWSKADGHTYNPNEGGYLIEADNIVNNQVGGIPINSVNIYKANNGKWEVYKPFNFKSEINWGNWNKEIPQNTQLMKEYNAIEQAAKANDAWMKNPDGSQFTGTPEQFVQQQSGNFKKAFPQNAEITYRGIKNNTPDLLTNRAIFTADKRLAKAYTTNDKILTPSSSIDDKGLYEMYRKRSNNGIEVDVRGSH